MITVKHIGRPRGSTRDKNIPHDAYPEIVRRFDAGQELSSDIGKDYGVGPVAIRSLVKRYKANPGLLVVGNETG